MRQTPTFRPAAPNTTHRLTSTAIVVALTLFSPAASIAQSQSPQQREHRGFVHDADEPNSPLVNLAWLLGSDPQTATLEVSLIGDASREVTVSIKAIRPPRGTGPQS